MFHRQRKDLYDREIIMAEIAPSCLARIPPFARWRIPQETVSPLARRDPQIVTIVFRFLIALYLGIYFFFQSRCEYRADISYKNITVTMREMLVQILFNEQIILLIKVSKRNVLKF